MNKKHWEQYYRDLQPTPFAKFCVKYIPKRAYIVEFGCGNGRDSYFFIKHNAIVHGIDYAFLPYSSRLAYFSKTSLAKFIDLHRNDKLDVVYSRFFLHSITNSEIISLVEWSQGLFMAEFRDIADQPKLYKDHKRNLVSGEWVKQLLIKNNFKIIYYGKSRGWAKYKNEDPLVVRIIAKKNVSIR